MGHGIINLHLRGFCQIPKGLRIFPEDLASDKAVYLTALFFVGLERLWCGLIESAALGGAFFSDLDTLLGLPIQGLGLWRTAALLGEGQDQHGFFIVPLAYGQVEAGL